MIHASFYQLDVFRNTYRASVLVMTQIVARLPAPEQQDLAAQLRYSSKAVPRLIASAFAKRQDRQAFRHELVAAAAECQQLIVSLSHCRHLYPDAIANPRLLELLLEVYDATARKLSILGAAWAAAPTRREPEPAVAVHDLTASLASTAVSPGMRQPICEQR